MGTRRGCPRCAVLAHEDTVCGVPGERREHVQVESHSAGGSRERVYPATSTLQDSGPVKAESHRSGN